MKLNRIQVLSILTYWYALVFMSGWLSNGAEPINILCLIALDLWGFLASMFFVQRFQKSEESEKGDNDARHLRDFPDHRERCAAM